MATHFVTGLVLGDDAVAWTTLQIKGRGRVVGSGREELPSAPAPEAGGAEGAAPAADRLRAACKGLKGSRIVAGLSTEHLLLRVVNLPSADDGEIAGMVDLQVDKLSPFPLDTMVVGREVLRRDHDNSLVLIAAAKADGALGLCRTLAAADVTVERLDAVIMGWWRLLRDAGEVGTAGRQVFLIMDAGAPEMLVAQDGIPILFRSIAGPGGLDSDAAVAEAARDVAHSLMSLEMEHGGGAATSILLWYRGPEPAGLAAVLRTECDCGVECRSLEAWPSASEGLARRFMSAEAAGLDLTPPDWRAAREAGIFRRRMWIGAAAVVAVCGLCLAGLLGGVAYQRHRLGVLNAKIEALSGPVTEVQNMRRRVRTVARYRDVRSSALECLREISSLLPQGVNLTSFTYRKAESVKIEGDADEVNVIYALKSKLDGSPLFVGSELTGPRRDTRRNKEVFEVDLKLSGETE